MGTNPKIDRVLERFEPGRRDALRKIVIGSAVYVAPVVASFSMDSLGGIAQAQGNNQTRILGANAVPAPKGWSLAALAALVSAAGAYLLRRRRDGAKER
jgi:IPTL-CTERM motif